MANICAEMELEETFRNELNKHKKKIVELRNLNEIAVDDLR